MEKFTLPYLTYPGDHGPVWRRHHVPGVLGVAARAGLNETAASPMIFVRVGASPLERSRRRESTVRDSTCVGSQTHLCVSGDVGVALRRRRGEV